jgi:hypothetical protein
MKYVLVISFILCGYSAVFSQDFVTEFQKLTLENDSLQKQVIKPLNDSIIKLNSTHSEEMSKSHEYIETLKNDIADLNKDITFLKTEIAGLNKNKVKVERDNLQGKVDSLFTQVTELKKIISQKELQIEKEKQNGEQKSKQEKEKGKNQVLNQIIQTYNKPFDELIKSSTLNLVKRDLLILGNQEKLLDLQKYHKSVLVLSQKYNEQKVETALIQIGTLDQFELRDNLTDKLSKYNLYNAGLKSTFNNILEIDKQFVGNDEYAKKAKKQEILFELSEYCRNYYDYIHYPYLSKIILELISLKSKNVDSDISILLDKL